METQPRDLPSAKPTADDEADARDQLRTLGEEVLRLEEAWQSRRLGSALAAGAPAGGAAQQIREIYRRQLGKRRRPYRLSAVPQILEAARGILAEPVRVFEARGILQRRCLTDPVGPWHLLGVAVEGEHACALRRGQLRSSRSWGLGLRFVDPMVRRLHATTMLRYAVHGIAADLCSLGAIDEEVESTFKGKLASGVGRRFEQLVLDVLNLESTRAAPATLVEDLLQKTDLWFQLSPGHRARVQVSLLADRRFHEQKLRLIRCREELVIVTPRTLAAAVLGRGGDGLLSGPERAALPEAVGTGDAVDRLAFSLHGCFLEAIARCSLHPLGPAALLPPPVIRLIARFVEREAPFAWQAQKNRERQVAQEGTARAA